MKIIIFNCERRGISYDLRISMFFGIIEYYYVQSGQKYNIMTAFHL